MKLRDLRLKDSNSAIADVSAGEFILRAVKNPKNKKNPAMILAIAESYKTFRS